jgi:hypothetical protein
MRRLRRLDLPGLTPSLSLLAQLGEGDAPPGEVAARTACEHGVLELTNNSGTEGHSNFSYRKQMRGRKASARSARCPRPTRWISTRCCMTTPKATIFV